MATATAPADLARFGDRCSFFDMHRRASRVGQPPDASTSHAEVDQQDTCGLVAPSGPASFVVLRPGSALSRTTRDMNASAGAVWTALQAKEAGAPLPGMQELDAAEALPVPTKAQASPAVQTAQQRRCSSAATWTRLSTATRTAKPGDVLASTIVMPLERVRQLQGDAAARKVFMRSVQSAVDDERRRLAEKRAAATAPPPVRPPTGEPEMSLSGDATFSALSAAADFFSRATAVRATVEKRARHDGVFARRELSRCTKLLRTAEDLERPDVQQRLRIEATEHEILCNSWHAFSVVALFCAELHLRFQREMWQHSTLRAAHLNSSAASYSLRGICGKRLQWELRRSARFLWQIWLLYRPKIRRLRKERSTVLIVKFFTAVQASTRVTVALSRFMKTVRNVQAHMRSGRSMRKVRIDMAHRQTLRGIPLSQATDDARVVMLKEQFEKREAEIVAKKTGTRATKSIKIAELRQVLDQELAVIQRRSSPKNVELILANPAVFLKVVDGAIAKRLEDYSKQVSRYARAVLRYIDQMDDLRSRGLLPKQLKTKTPGSSAAERELAFSARGRQDEQAKGRQSMRSGTIVIPTAPVRPYFHSLFSFDEIQVFMEDTLDELRVP